MSKVLVRFTVNTSDGAEIKLEVGDHSPIWVIKEELQRETGRPLEDQILCLLNDKGDEGELLEHNRATVYDCGIHSGSTLFLSFLTSSPAVSSPAIVGTPRLKAGGPAGAGDAASADDMLVDAESEAAAAERARNECRAWCSDMQAQRQAQRDASQIEEESQRYGQTDPAAPAAITTVHPAVPCILTTDKSPGEAEHSFNGVMFNVQAKEPYEISINSVHVGGMLGTMSVYACNEGSWCGDERSLQNYGGYGRQDYKVRPEEWQAHKQSPILL